MDVEYEGKEPITLPSYKQVTTSTSGVRLRAVRTEAEILAEYEATAALSALLKLLFDLLKKRPVSLEAKAAMPDLESAHRVAIREELRLQELVRMQDGGTEEGAT